MEESFNLKMGFFSKLTKSVFKLAMPLDPYDSLHLIIFFYLFLVYTINEALRLHLAPAPTTSASTAEVDNSASFKTFIEIIFYFIGILTMLLVFICIIYSYVSLRKNGIFGLKSNASATTATATTSSVTNATAATAANETAKKVAN